MICLKEAHLRKSWYFKIWSNWVITCLKKEQLLSSKMFFWDGQQKNMHSSFSGYSCAKAMRKPANDCLESQRIGRAWHTLECPYIPLRQTGPAVQDASPQLSFNMLISFCLILRPPSAAGSERPAVPCTRKLFDLFNLSSCKITPPVSPETS